MSSTNDQAIVDYYYGEVGKRLGHTTLETAYHFGVTEDHVHGVLARAYAASITLQPKRSTVLSR